MASHPHEDESDRHDEPTPGPAENADPATKADMGLTGTPARAYSPEGMADAGDADGDTDEDDAADDDTRVRGD